MSARFYEVENNGETQFRFTDNEDYDIELTEDNLAVYAHRKEPLKDMAAVLDTRDEAWWTWYRYDLGDDHFDQIVFVARAVGTFMLRDTATPEVQAKFDARHQFTDNDFDELLGDHDGS